VDARGRHRGKLLGDGQHAALDGDRLAREHARESSLPVPALAAVEHRLHHAVEVLDAGQSLGGPEMRGRVEQHALLIGVELEALADRACIERDGRVTVELRGIA